MARLTLNWGMQRLHLPFLVPALSALIGLAPGAEVGSPPSLTPAPSASTQPAAPVVTSAESAPLVVTATRFDAPLAEQPYAFYPHQHADLAATNGRTLTDQLASTPGVFMQRTAPNQASPYLRGLTGEQTLLLFDGVRLNHALMRPGPNQYAAMIQPEAVGRIDTILGSTSAVTGSDGLTGALDFRLAEAGRGVDAPISVFAGERVDTAWGRRAYGGLDGNAGDWGYSLEASFEDYDDLRGGKDAGDHLFGPSAGSRTIPNSGYRQLGGGGRVVYRGFDRQRIELAAGMTEQTAATRPDGYFANSGVAARQARYYDPQRFAYTHLRHVIDIDGPIEQVQTTGWFHHHDETQIRDDISGGRYRRRTNEDSVDTVGLDLQLASRVAKVHALTYGGTAYQDRIESDFTRARSPAAVTTATNLTVDQTSATAPGSTTVPDGSRYTGTAVFLQDAWAFLPRWDLIAGLRYSRNDWNYTVTDDRAGFNLDGNAATTNAALSQEMDGSAAALTGNLRLGWQATDEVYAFTGIGQGFRAPNLSNLAGIQDRGSSSSGGTGPQVAGNPDLEPEQSITVELGGRWVSGRDTIAATVFATQLRNLIQVVYRDVDGNGTITAADSAQSVNAEDGLLTGFEIGSDTGVPVGLPTGWRLAVVQSTSLVSGEADVPQPVAGGGTDEQHISRANLVFGKAGLKLESAVTWWVMPQVRWQDRYDEVAPGDATDTRHTTFRAKGGPNGAMPGYAALDLLVGWVSRDGDLRVTASIENMLDHTYRAVGSGTDGSGINGVLAIEGRL